jgi:preprotein translocase subunit SecD
MSGEPSYSLEAVKAAMGIPAWAAAMDLAGTAHDVSGISADPAMVNVLEPFGRLTPAEVTVLPAGVQFYVPQIGCATLNAPANGATDNPQATVVVCDNEGTKYLLDVAKVSGADVSSAGASLDTTLATGAWAVDIAFSSTGTRRWTALTSEAVHNDGGDCIYTTPATDTRQVPVCQIALVQDNKVLIAPAIQAVLPSDVRLSESFSQEQAMTLAAQRALAGLSVRITVVSVSS